METSTSDRGQRIPKSGQNGADRRGVDTAPPRRDNTANPTKPTTPRVPLTLIENATGPATKMFALDGAGQLTKRSAAQIYEGTVSAIEVDGLKGLLEIIEGLAPNQALTYGVPAVSAARLLTQEDLRQSRFSDAVARDRDHFRFAQGQPGVLMLDHDCRLDRQPLRWQAIDEIMCAVVPAWQAVERVWRPSASAFIYRDDGEELIGEGGWRCYVIVDDAAKIPDVGAYIYQALWAAGHGYILISKAGQPLDRALVDPSVWQPERLDFAAAPVLASGLQRRAPEADLIPGGAMLASVGLAPAETMTEWRATCTVLHDARKAVHAQIDQARKTQIEKLVGQIKQRTPKVQVARTRTVVARAVENLCLSGDFVLHRPDGGSVTVAEMLSDPDKWHGARFADPLEPDYRGDKRISFACLQTNGGVPFVYSHAHGGMRYSLLRESADIRLVRGEQPRVVDQALDLLRARGDVFERGGELVRLGNSEVAPIGDEWLLDYFGRHVRFTALRSRRGETTVEQADAPPWLARRVTAKHGEWGLRELRAVITAPTMRADGTLLVTPGYDAASGLLLRPGRWPRIPEEPTKDQLKVAAFTLWRPFAEFPFVDETARSVMLATLLTGIVRQALPLAPGTSFDAPDAGSGKTLLGKCLLVLCGMPPTVIPECRDEEEIRKRLLAALRTGQPGILFDNIRGQFGSAAIEAMLTAEHYSDRLLGASQLIALPTTALILFSGNNFRPSGDLWRRILTARIDAKSETPERRSFALDPLAHCLSQRQSIVAAGLTLLRGFVNDGSPRVIAEKLASFEAWDGLVRQAVMWIQAQQLMPEGASVGDPVKAIDDAKEAEPERQKLFTLLSAVNTIKGDQRWSVAELIKKIQQVDASPIATEGTPLANLHSVVHEIAGERGRINSRLLGRWIERHTDRRIAGLWIERSGGRSGVALWKVRKIAAS